MGNPILEHLDTALREIAVYIASTGDVETIRTLNIARSDLRSVKYSVAKVLKADGKAGRYSDV